MTEEEKAKKEAEEAEKKELETVAKALTPMVLEEIKASKPLRKDIFGSGDTDTKATDLAERRQAGAEYLKALVNKDGVQRKALSSGTSTSGSELVPTIVSDQIITVAQKYGLIRKNAKKWPMQSINENVPTMSTLTAYRLAGDTAAVTASQPTTGALQLRAKTIGVIVPVSKVLLQNSTPDVMDAITDLAGKAIAKLEDQWGYLGLASGEGLFQTSGISTVTMASGNDEYNQATAENLLDLIDVIDENFIGDNMRWIMSLSILNVFRRLRAVVGTDKQGFLFEAFGGNVPSTMWDIPYDTSAVMPKATDSSNEGKPFLGLVDYDNVIYGDRMEYQMEISDQATITDTDGSTLINLFQQNMVALKVWGLVDIEYSNPTKAHAVLKTAAS